jgi:alkyl hydroperoxide reductase subunit AhpF
VDELFVGGSMEKFLDENVKKQLTEVFGNLDHTVVLLFFSGEENCDYCRDTRELLRELKVISGKIELREFERGKDDEDVKKYNVDKTPTIIATRKKGDDLIDYGIRFAGIPAGHEFSAFINAIISVSTDQSTLSAQTKEFLAGLKQPINLQVFTTPT